MGAAGTVVANAEWSGRILPGLDDACDRAFETLDIGLEWLMALVLAVLNLRDETGFCCLPALFRLATHLEQLESQLVEVGRDDLLVYSRRTSVEAADLWMAYQLRFRSCGLAELCLKANCCV